MIIRPATFEDLAAVISLGEEMHKSSNFKHLEWDARHFGERVVSLITSPDHDIFLAVVDGDVAGGILCGIGPGLSTRNLVAYELGLYVTPDYRRTSAASQLLRAYVRWSRDRGAKRITAGNSAGAPDEGYVKLLTKSGFERTGSLMCQIL